MGVASGETVWRICRSHVAGDLPLRAIVDAEEHIAVSVATAHLEELLAFLRSRVCSLTFSRRKRRRAGGEGRKTQQAQRRHRHWILKLVKKREVGSGRPGRKVGIRMQVAKSRLAWDASRAVIRLPSSSRSAPVDSLLQAFGHTKTLAEACFREDPVHPPL